MASIHTQVAVIGAGPAGLTLANRLRQEGVSCVVLERESRDTVETTPRAGFVEEWAVRALDRHGLASPELLLKAPRHRSVEFRFERAAHTLDYASLTGHHHYVHPQQDLVTDLLARYVDGGGDIRFGVTDLRVHDALTSRSPSLTWTEPAADGADDAPGTEQRLECDFVAGCDGARGITHAMVAGAGATVTRQDHGVGWLTLLARTAPSKDSVILGVHPRGFAAHMPRSSDVTRFYLQCRPGEDPAAWTEDRIWTELHARLTTGDSKPLSEGPLLERRVLALHDYVVQPMGVGRLHLAGDAAHLIAPIGAKGMNLALHDALHLAQAYAVYYARARDESALAAYGAACLAQAWDYQEFSAWLSEVYHGPAAGGFRAGLATTRLRRLFQSGTAARAFSALYIGTGTSAP